MAAGIEQRHGNRRSRKSRCECPWRVSVYSKRDGKKIRKTFATKAEATSWRRDAGGAVEKQLLRAPTSITLELAAADWFEGARSGVIRNRSGDIYKPAAVRGYEQGWRLRIKHRMGRKRLCDVTRTDLQDLALLSG